MRYFPIFLDLDDRKVVIAGGGEAAVRKLRLVLKTAAQITVYSQIICDEIAEFERAGRIVVIRRPAVAADIAGAALAYAATGARKTDAAFAALARSVGVPVNAVDQPDICDFITPAIVDRDPVTVAIGTEGTAPVLARLIKARIEAMLPASTGAIARLASSWRGRLAALVPEPRARRRLWQRFFAGGIPAADNPTHLATAQIRLQALAGAAALAGEGPGLVTLVDVDADNPGLLTPNARRRLHEADVIVHVPGTAPRLVELARREAKFIAVTSAETPPEMRPGFGSGAGEILVREARMGQRVVRLGMGEGTDALALGEAGIEFEIEPGTPAAALPAPGSHPPAAIGAP